MSRKLIAVMAVMCFAFVGVTFAAVENIKVSGDINTQGVTRDLSMSGNDSEADNVSDEKYIFSQVRVRFDADLTEGVSAVVRLINERMWGGDDNDPEVNNHETDVNLDLACVELKEFLYQPLTFIVGRQNLRFGNALIIGDPDTNRLASVNKVPEELSDLTLRKSFDAVRAVLDYAPWTIDVILAKIDESTINETDDITIIGTNIAYDWASYNGVSEAYFYSVDRAPYQNAAGTANSVDPDNNLYVAGLRAQADVIDKLTLGAEVAYQFGDLRIAENIHDDIKAYAAQVIGEYRFLDDYNSKVGLNYTFLSGDDTLRGGAWNPVFEDQSPGEIINILFSNSNMHYVQATGSIMPKEDITLGATYVFASMANTNSASTLSVTDTAAEGFGTINLDTTQKDIGHEVDVSAVYDYTEDVQLNLCGAWFFPGHVFDNNTNDKVAYSIRGGVNVDF